VGRSCIFEIYAADLDRAERFYTEVTHIVETELAVAAVAGGEQVLDRMAADGVGQVACSRDTEGKISAAPQPALG